MIRYQKVPADKLMKLGVQDILRTPSDGVDRNNWISWETARLAVQAAFTGEYNELPDHSIVVTDADGRGGSTSFSADVLDKGIVSVNTVSGGDLSASLSRRQSRMFRKLVEQSIEAGPVESWEQADPAIDELSERDQHILGLHK